MVAVSYNMVGMNRNGKEVFCTREDNVETLGGKLIIDVHRIQREYPEAICVTMAVALPDPQVVALKAEMKKFIEPVGQTTDDIIEALFRNFNIKGLE